MDALNLLERDHKKVKGLFNQANKAREGKKCRDLFVEIETKLEIHDYLEKTVLYPAIEKHEELKETAQKALAEHRDLKTLFQEAEDIGFDGGEFDCNFKMLMDSVQDHLDAEEDEVFLKVREVLDAARLDELARELEAARVNITSSGGIGSGGGK